jgi:D-glycero-alpha-D-manno-heptose 1-phosphate guanylyltransferase
MSFDDVSVVILAGGRGTRLQGLHPDTPKPMIEVAGEPFLHWLTVWIARQGLRHFVYSTGYMSEQIEAWAQNGAFPELLRQCRHEETPLGTGGALLNCLDLCRDWVLVANGDSLVMGGISELLALVQSARNDGGLFGVEVEDTARYGSLGVTHDGKLTGFSEKVSGKGLINAGVYLFRTALLREIMPQGACSIEYDLFPRLIESHADLRVVRLSDAPFIDIGTPATLEQAKHFVTMHLISTT